MSRDGCKTVETESSETRPRQSKACSKCEKETLGEAKFCNFCGNRFSDRKVIGAEPVLKPKASPFIAYRRNAYRILGLPVSASQKEILDSVASMKRGLKIGKTKKTDWDLSFVGMPERAAADIQEAERRLVDPELRLAERLHWFDNSAASKLNDLDLNGVEKVCVEWLASGTSSSKHDVAVLRTIAASIRDPEFNSEDLWQEVCESWTVVAAEDDYWIYLFDLDENGQFEPAVSSSEIFDLQQNCLRRALAPLIDAGIAAAQQKDRLGVSKILAFLKKSLPTESAEVFALTIAEPLEKEFETVCESFRHDCSDLVKREDDNTQADIRENKKICDQLRARYCSEIQPGLNQIVDVFGPDSEVSARAKESAAVCLKDVALSYTWADDLETSKAILNESSELAQGTFAHSRIEGALASIEEQAKASEIWKDLKPIKSAPPLYTNWGFGVMIYPNLFKQKYDPDLNSYLATYYLTCFWIPVFPLARYRIINAGESSYRFLGQAPMERSDQIHRLITVVAFVWFFLIPKPQVETPKTSATSATVQSDAAERQRHRELIASLNTEVESGRVRIKDLQSELEQKKAEIDSMKSELSPMKEEIISFENQVSAGVEVDRPTYEAVLEQHNALVTKINEVRDEYNKTFEEYEQLLAKDKRAVHRYNELISGRPDPYPPEPTDSQGFKARAMARLKQRDLKNGLADLNKAIVLDKKESSNYKIRSRILLSMGEYRKALRDLDTASKLKETPPDWDRGYLEFCVGDNNAARKDLKSWLISTEWKNKRAPFAVIWYMLASKRGTTLNDVNAMESEASTKLNQNAWPYPVIEYLVGRLSRDELLEKATDNDKQTEANAYIGMDLVSTGCGKDAKKYFEWVRSKGNKNFFEYKLANSELQNLGGHR